MPARKLCPFCRTALPAKELQTYDETVEAYADESCSFHATALQIAEAMRWANAHPNKVLR
jgi:hypothetical protein